MGIAIPQLAPASPDRSSGAQVINGSMLFTGVNYLTRTPGSATNRKTWTFSAWVKRWAALDESSNYSTIFGANSDGMELYFLDDGKLSFYDYSGGGYQARLVTTERFRDPTGWYHIVAVSDTTDALNSFRWRLYVNGKRITKFSTETYPSVNYDTGVNSTGLHVLGRYGTGADNVRKAKLYQTNNYLIDGLALGPGYFGYTDPLSGQWKPKKFRAQGTTVNDGKVFSSTGTFSNWDDDGSYPKTELFDGTIYSGGTPNGASSDDGNAATFDFGEQRITGFSNLKINIFLSSNQASATNVVSVNGRDITNECHAAGNDEWTTVDLQDKFTTLQSFSIANNNIYVGGFIVDGVIMKDSTTENLAFGDNGFYMPFEDQSDFEKDKSGNGNDFTKNGFTGTETDPDIVKDSPAGPALGGMTGLTTTSAIPSNYATWNPLDNHGNTLDIGNLTASNTAGSWYASFGTIPSSNGKHYFEVTPTTLTTTCAIGVYVGIDRDGYNGSYPYNSRTYMIHQNGYIYHNSSTYSYQNTYSAGDTVGVAVDSENRKVWISVNGNYVSGENPTTGVGGLQSVTGVGAMPTDAPIYPVVSNRSAVAKVNFGQKPFKYAPPEGYLPLSYASIGAGSSVAIPNAKRYVGVTTYVGSSGNVVVNNLNFKPDAVWIKQRNSGGGTNDHVLVDSVRGRAKSLYPSATYSENTSAADKDLISFDRNGFTVGQTNQSAVNRGSSSYDYVAWCWKAGGNKNTFNVDDVGYASAAAAGLDGGTYTPTGASIGTKQGFSIIKYTGSASTGTFSHGLSQAPDFMICKRIASGPDWVIYHRSLGSNKVLYFTNATKSTSTAAWNNTNPTSSLVHVGNSGDTNSSDSQIYYIWHDVPGLQKFGRFIGGGSRYPFIELGFSPAIVILKNVDTGGSYYDWEMFDNKRDPFNRGDDNDSNGRNELFANSSTAENYGDTTYGWNTLDFLANGFRVNDSSVSLNKDGDTIIYAAWAEAPSFGFFGGGANAF